VDNRSLTFLAILPPSLHSLSLSRRGIISPLPPAFCMLKMRAICIQESFRLARAYLLREKAFKEKGEGEVGPDCT
jgi:hypothetical protein